MKRWQGFLVMLGVVALAGAAFAQGETTIGVFWDTAATQTLRTAAGGFDVNHTAYIYCVDSEQVVGGAAFMLAKDTRLTDIGQVFPAGVQIGDLYTGLQIGLTTPQIGYYGTPVWLGTVTYWAANLLLENAEISVVAYPAEGAILLSDHNGELREVAGGTAYLTIPVDNDETSWGAVKNLYGN